MFFSNWFSCSSLCWFKKLHLSEWETLIARGKNTLQQKISAMLFSLLISYDKDREVRPVHPFRLLITLHKITFTFGGLFQLQLWNSAGFKHCFNHLDQNRKESSPLVKSFPFPVLLYVCIINKETFLNAESPVYGSWDMNFFSFTKMDFNEWVFICFITFSYLMWFLFYFSRFFL